MSLSFASSTDALPVAGVTPLPSALRAPTMRDAVMAVPTGWRAKSGAALEGEAIRLRIVGNPSGPAVLVLGGISAGRLVTAEDDGWWSRLAGPGRAIDTDHVTVIGADYPPEALREAADLCPEDFARLLHAALTRAGISSLKAIIGASFGGMIALAFARLYPETTGAVSVLCAAHRPSPMGTALRLVQRQILELTSGTNREADGVALARQLAMTTYRTQEEFDERFGRGGEDLEAYLGHHGRQYAGRISAARYLTLSNAIDQHEEDPRQIKVPVQVIAADSDRLVPLSLVQEFASWLPNLDGYHVLRSVYGHDAFLKECRAIAPLLRRFLS
ncbi:MAG: alpha/beta fold hydrolase [Parvularcula sp.]|jgi:homoserine O-acetyltransferase|nr:alpha/beta fold hydrolase [Parvularcula sp.]